MLTGIDHLVIAVADPDAAVAELERGVGLRPRRRRPSRRARDVQPARLARRHVPRADRRVRRDARAATHGSAPRRSGRSSRAADSRPGRSRPMTSMPTSRGFATRGSDLAAPIGGERVRPDGRVVRWRLSTPPRLDPDRPPFLIEHDVTRRRVDARRIGPSVPPDPARLTRRSSSPSTTSTARARRSCGRSGCGSGRRSPAAARATPTSARRSCGFDPDGPVARRGRDDRPSLDHGRVTRRRTSSASAGE